MSGTRGRAGVVALLALPLGGCGGDRETSVLTMYAAKSLQDVLPDVAAAWKAESGKEARFDFDATSRLVQKVLEGAPADVFFSADEIWMERLVAGGKAVEATRAVVARNELVFVVPAGAADGPPEPTALPGRLRKIALAGENVPAGKYAKAALEALGAWKGVESRVVRGDDVRITLRWVASGEADGGVVYRTDALVEPKVRVAFAFAPGTHPPIVYPAAAVKGAARSVDGAAFVAFCRSAAAQAAFRRHGFLPAAP
jgi:molybdate transport system substrate-binding protein